MFDLTAPLTDPQDKRVTLVADLLRSIVPDELKDGQVIVKPNGYADALAHGAPLGKSDPLNQRFEPLEDPPTYLFTVGIKAEYKGEYFGIYASVEADGRILLNGTRPISAFSEYDPISDSLMPCADPPLIQGLEFEYPLSTEQAERLARQVYSLAPASYDFECFARMAISKADTAIPMKDGITVVARQMQVPPHLVPFCMTRGYNGVVPVVIQRHYPQQQEGWVTYDTLGYVELSGEVKINAGAKHINLGHVNDILA